MCHHHTWAWPGTALLTLSFHLHPGRDQGKGINETSSASERAQGRDEAASSPQVLHRAQVHAGQAEPTAPQEEDETGDIQLSGRGTQKNKVVPPSEQSCCWEEIVGEGIDSVSCTPLASLLSCFAPASPAWPRELGYPSRPAPTLLKGQKTSLHVKCRIRYLL